ncbi:serine hydrolase [Lactobacillus rossiae]|uniref:Serine hydrolase n=2 Tax=Furfurilactobacillus TaxID=2767882 RepID=A0A7C9JEZ3_9LACO|nr:serine hydrolase [Furfurilactobacillus milii]
MEVATIMKRCLLILLCLSGLSGVIVSPTTPVQADAMPVSQLALDAKTGHVYQEENASTVRPIASISKLFTVYFALQKIHQGKLKLTDTVTAPANIASLSQDSRLANVPLQAGKKYSVRDLLYTSLIHSANSSVLLLAQKMFGSQEKAVKQINHQAHVWHLKHYQLVNVTGLNNYLIGDLRVPGTPEDAENKMSAKDVATVARKTLSYYGDQLLSIASEPRVNFDLSGSFPTENRMLPTQPDHFNDTPVDGLKTGSSEGAGNCFVDTAKKHHHRVITVVLGADYANKDQVFQITHQLFTTSFQKITQ